MRGAAIARGIRGAAVLVGLGLVVAATLPLEAQQRTRVYFGPHPVDLDGTWHVEDGRHEYGDLPVGLAPFAEVSGVWIFLADPVDYGYDGPTYAFDGVHPLPTGLDGYCGISGEHVHPFVPEGVYRRDDEAYAYAGALRGGVPQVRPLRARNEDLRDELERPIVATPFFPAIPFGHCARVLGGVGGPVFTSGPCRSLLRGARGRPVRAARTRPVESTRVTPVRRPRRGQRGSRVRSRSGSR